MSEINVQIERLKPMRMLSSYGYGKEPEMIAWNKLIEYATSLNIYDPENPPSTYGFNNPNPSDGSPNYGYEIWLPVEADIEPAGDLRIVDFQGGLYGVTTFKNLFDIGKVWGELVKWRESSKYLPGPHQCLEELKISPENPPEEYIFNLYIPIVER
jgi:effector-binding domain-containing protein